jgi:hypothetical protein
MMGNMAVLLNLKIISMVPPRLKMLRRLDLGQHLLQKSNETFG